MNPNLAVTTPSSDCVNELKVRSELLINNKGWALKRHPWIHVFSGAIIDTGVLNKFDYETRKKYRLFAGDLDTLATSYVLKNKPASGITNFNIENKGTMGSTRKAVINFQCWTIQDLQIMEQLYMVPGMTIVCEWGWSMTSKGEPVYPLDVNGPIGLFDNINNDPNYVRIIMEYIIAKRKEFKYSYDGFVGVVTNFEYTLNENLGYDCEIEIISPGELFLEYSSKNNSIKAKKVTSDFTITNKKKKVYLNNFQEKCDKYYTDFKNDNAIRNENANGLAIISQIWELEPRDFDVEYESVGGTISRWTNQMFGANPAIKSKEIYLSWGNFIKTLNRNIGLTQDGKSTDINISSPNLALDIIPVSITPIFYSTDPRITTCNTKNIILDTGALNASNTKTYPVKLPDIDDVNNAKQSVKSFGDSSDINSLNTYINDFKSSELGIGYLNNIFINAAYLRDIFNNTDELNMQQVLDRVLLDISSCYGNLWNLGYYVDELDPNKLHIIDYNYTSIQSRKKQISPFKFTIREPLNNNEAQLLVRTTSVKSKLPDGFKMMALYGSKESSNGVAATNSLGAFKFYSKNVIDKYKPYTSHVTSSNIPSKDPVEENSTDAKRDFLDAYENLVDAVVDAEVDSAKSAFDSYILFLRSKDKPQMDKLPSENNIILPFEFTIVIDGFSGFVWGNAIGFDHLPERYTDKIYFQIKNIKQEVTLGDWVTTIETVMRLKETENNSIKIT